MPIELRHAFSELTDLVSGATVDLVGDFGIRLVAHGPCGTPTLGGKAIAATIGYAGEAMRGSLLLLAPSDGAMALWPPETEIKPTAVAMRDLIGEFANMLVGRLKLKLLAHDVVILLGTPTTSSGAGLCIDGVPGSACVWLAFESPTGELFVRFDAMLVPNFEMKPSPARQTFVFGQPLLF
jgi:CheY-specific phosphatase CheX